MLAHESTYCVSVPGGNAEVSLNGLRAILGQVEAELHHSEIYGQMLSSLQTLPEDVNRQVQCMVRAVGREAIRLALRKMVRKKPSAVAQIADSSFAGTASSADPKAPLVPPSHKISTVATADDRSLPSLPADASTATQTPPAVRERVTLYPPTVTSTTRHLKTNAHKKPSKRELAQKAAMEAREACLKDLGQTIRQARQEKTWSPYHLHIKTQIPLHQLEALETGRIDRLPEDIYLRGFIRQAGNALGLDGTQMAASLPAIDSASAVLPSWQQPKTPSGFRINSMQVYLGYAALMAGGIAWVSHQSMPQQTGSASPPAPATVAPLPKATPNQPANFKVNQKDAAALSVKQGQGRIAPVPGNISPPETSPLGSLPQ